QPAVLDSLTCRGYTCVTLQQPSKARQSGEALWHGLSISRYRLTTQQRLQNFTRTCLALRSCTANLPTLGQTASGSAMAISILLSSSTAAKTPRTWEKARPR